MGGHSWALGLCRGARGAMREENILLVCKRMADSISVLLREGRSCPQTRTGCRGCGGGGRGAPAPPSPTFQALLSFHFTGEETGRERTSDLFESHARDGAQGLRLNSDTCVMNRALLGPLPLPIA